MGACAAQGQDQTSIKRLLCRGSGPLPQPSVRALVPTFVGHLELGSSFCMVRTPLLLTMTSFCVTLTHLTNEHCTIATGPLESCFTMLNHTHDHWPTCLAGHSSLSFIHNKAHSMLQCINLRGRELNPGLPRVWQISEPLYYHGIWKVLVATLPGHFAPPLKSDLLRARLDSP